MLLPRKTFSAQASLEYLCLVNKIMLTYAGNSRGKARWKWLKSVLVTQLASCVCTTAKAREPKNPPTPQPSNSDPGVTWHLIKAQRKGKQMEISETSCCCHRVLLLPLPVCCLSAHTKRKYNQNCVMISWQQEMVNGLGFQGVLGLFLVDPVEWGEGGLRGSQNTCQIVVRVFSLFFFFLSAPQSPSKWVDFQTLMPGFEVWLSADRCDRWIYIFAKR